MYKKEDLETLDIRNLKVIAYPYLKMGVQKYTPQRKDDLISFILKKQEEK